MLLSMIVLVLGIRQIDPSASAKGNQRHRRNQVACSFMSYSNAHVERVSGRRDPLALSSTPRVHEVYENASHYPEILYRRAQKLPRKFQRLESGGKGEGRSKRIHDQSATADAEEMQKGVQLIYL